MDVISFLNGILDDLGLEQNAEDWAHDPLRPGFTGWWTANLPGTNQLIEVYIDHFSQDGCGYSNVRLTGAA